jgi:hypothetical protein
MANFHFYYMRKLWKSPVINKKILEWQVLLGKINQLDITNTQYACPPK